MRFVLAGLVLVTLTSPSHANQCDLTSPRAGAGSVAAGCPLVIYVPTAHRGSSGPTFSVLRGGEYVELPMTLHEVMTTLDISTVTKDPETCIESEVVAPMDMTMFSVEIEGIAEGDWIRGTGGDIYVGAPAACHHYPPRYYCDAPAGACDDEETGGMSSDDGVGCSAGGLPGLLPAALVLLLRRRRPR